MLVVILNGPINAGKTVTGRALATMLPGWRFIDGDDHGAPEGTPFEVMLATALSRLEWEIAAAVSNLVIAYPLREEDFTRLRTATDARQARLIVVTLAPPPAVAFINRGTRELEPHEVERSREMHAEGYASRGFSDLIVTDMAGADVTARQIFEHFGLGR